MSDKVMHSINEKTSDFLKNMHFWVKSFFRNSQISPDLVGAIGFLEALDMD